MSELVTVNRNNFVSLEGRISSEPRRYRNHLAIVRIAVSKPIASNNNSGSSAYFFPVAVSGNLCDYVCENASVGQEIYIEGMLVMNETRGEDNKKFNRIGINATGVQLGNKSKNSKKRERTLDNYVGGVENKDISDFEESAEEDFDEQ